MRTFPTFTPPIMLSGREKYTYSNMQNAGLSSGNGRSERQSVLIDDPALRQVQFRE